MRKVCRMALKIKTTESPWALDFDDHRTSLIEQALVYIGVTCMIISTIAEVIQAIQAWQVMK